MYQSPQVHFCPQYDHVKEEAGKQRETDISIHEDHIFLVTEDIKFRATRDTACKFVACHDTLLY